MATQKGLFAELESTQAPTMPSGFRYQEDIISEADEAALVASLATLELKPFEFHGHVGNRRVTSFGLRYDYARRTVEPTERFPPFIEELRRKAADYVGRNIDEIQQGGVNQYPAGAGIVWHKNKPQLGVIIGFRF